MWCRLAGNDHDHDSIPKTPAPALPGHHPCPLRRSRVINTIDRPGGFREQRGEIEMPKQKLSQRLTREQRQLENHGAVPVLIRSFPGRVYWSGTVADLHGAKKLYFNGPDNPGFPEPLLMAPSTCDAAVAAEYAIADAHGVRMSQAIFSRSPRGSVD